MNIIIIMAIMAAIIEMYMKAIPNYTIDFIPFM